MAELSFIFIHFILRPFILFYFFLFYFKGPFGYRGEYGEKGIPGYPGARVRPKRCLYSVGAVGSALTVYVCIKNACVDKARLKS